MPSRPSIGAHGAIRGRGLQLGLTGSRLARSPARHPSRKSAEYQQSAEVHAASPLARCRLSRSLASLLQPTQVTPPLLLISLPTAPAEGRVRSLPAALLPGGKAAARAAISAPCEYRDHSSSPPTARFPLLACQGLWFALAFSQIRGAQQPARGFGVARQPTHFRRPGAVYGPAAHRRLLAGDDVDCASRQAVDHSSNTAGPAVDRSTGEHRPGWESEVAVGTSKNRSDMAAPRCL